MYNIQLLDGAGGKEGQRKRYKTFKLLIFIYKLAK